MTPVKNPFRRFRIRYRRSSTLLKCVVLAMVLTGTLALVVLRSALLQTERETEDLRHEAAALQQENKALERSISQLGTVESVKELANKLLGMVDPDTIIFEPEP